MIRLFATLIRYGRKTIDDIPESLREAVQKELDRIEKEGE